MMEHGIQPRTFWVLVGGCLLAFLNASVNAGLFFEVGNSVAQMSGEITRLSWTLLEYKRVAIGLNASVTVLAFLLGATLTGFVIHHPTVDKRLPYGRSLMFIGACLLIAHLFLPDRPRAALVFGGFASGFQNALATHYRGVILRTTHVTGLLTDVGSHLGMILRGHQIAAWKVWVPALVVIFFFLGGFFGAWLFFAEKPYLVLLGGTYLVSGTLWFIIQRIVLKIDFISRPLHGASRSKESRLAGSRKL